MHGCGNPQTQDRCMADNSESSGRPSQHRLSQRADSSRSLVASGTLHGARLANPSQSPASPGPAPSSIQADVEGFRSHGGRNRCQDGVAGETRRLAPMGNEPDDCREPLHPQVQTPVVEESALRGPVSVGNVLRLLEQQRYCCALTGRKLTPQTAAIDHIVPIRCSGEHSIANAQVLHKDVNRAKGSLTSEEFIGMCREVVRWSDASSTHMEFQS